MSYEYQSVEPTAYVSHVPVGATRVCTTRPCGYELGPSSDEELDLMAARALHAGHGVWIVATSRRLYGDEVADLYVL